MEKAPILVVEATAMRDGIKVALQASYRKIQVEDGNLIVNKVIQAQVNML